jgi:hypothetical protein
MQQELPQDGLGHRKARHSEVFISKIDENVGSKRSPTSEYSVLSTRVHVKRIISKNGAKFQGRPEGFQIEFVTEAVDDPNHLLVEHLARNALLGRYGGVLELDDEATIGLHVGNVSLSVICDVDDFLPGIGKQAFPFSMPFGFRFPPVIALQLLFMRPVPYPELAALCDDVHSTVRATATEFRLRLLACPIY